MSLNHLWGGRSQLAPLVTSHGTCLQMLPLKSSILWQMWRTIVCSFLSFLLLWFILTVSTTTKSCQSIWAFFLSFPLFFTFIFYSFCFVHYTQHRTLSKTATGYSDCLFDQSCFFFHSIRLLITNHLYSDPL